MKAKTTFKQTEMGTIPEEWNLLKINNIGKVITGTTPSKSKKEYYADDYPFFKPADLDSGFYTSISHDGLSEEGIKHARLLPEQSVLITCIGATIGKTGFIRSSGACNQQINAIIIKRDVAIPEFVFFWFDSHFGNKTIVNNASTTTMPILKKSKFENISLLLPPLSEQKKIVEILSSTYSSIKISDKIIQKTQLLKKSMMHQLLTMGIKHTKFKQTEIGEIPENWDFKKVTDLFEIETGTTPSTKNPTYWDDGNVNWFTPADMSELNGRLSINDSRRKITEKALKETNLSLMPKGSILLSTRAPVGYVAILEKPATFNQGCKGLIPKDEFVDSTFYAYLLSNKKDFLQSISSGSTFKELSKGSLISLVLPVPSLTEQQKISIIISEVDKKIELEITRKTKLEQIKQSLMNDLLTGKKRLN